MAYVPKYTLIDGLRAVSESPCDDCEYAQRCGSELLACSVYERWVNERSTKGYEKNPSRRVYQQIFYSGSGAEWEEDRTLILRDDLKGVA